MRPISLLLLFFIAGILSSPAQTLVTKAGLNTATFNLPPGVIKIYLPDDMRAGETISGSIKAEPSGKNARQLAKNLEGLKNYTVEFDGQKFQVSNPTARIQHTLTNNRILQRPLSITGSGGTNAGQISIVCPYGTETGNAPGESCHIPAHAMTASPLRINGAFDGNSDNTKCTVNGQPADILAESPRQCVIQYPGNIMGLQTVQVQEGDKMKCAKTVSSVNMDVSTGRLNLIKGEKTFLKVYITGLQGLPGKAKLSLENLATDVVVMMPSNSFAVVLDPDSVRSGVYEKSFDIQSIKTGNFSVNVDLDLPEASSWASVRKDIDQPPIYADNKGGIELHPLKVDGLKNGMSDAFKKAVIEITGNRATKYPELDGCGSCLTCIQSMLDEGKVALVGEIGKILMDHYVDLLVSGTGGALAWVKDKFDKLEKAGDIADAIADAVTKGEIQVVEFPEKLCGYCLVSAIGFYDTKTQCMDAFFYCKGSKMCCTHALTIIHLKYCVNDDGFKKPDAPLNIDVISR